MQLVEDAEQGVNSNLDPIIMQFECKLKRVKTGMTDLYKDGPDGPTSMGR